MKLAAIAQKLNCTIDGDPSIEITGVAGIEEAQPSELTFLSNRKYRPLLASTRASAIIVAKDAGAMRIAALRSANPHLDFARAIELFHAAPKYATGIHPTAVVAESARIGAGAHVGPYCFVDEETEIGAKAVLHSFVTIYRGAKIGDEDVYKRQVEQRHQRKRICNARDYRPPHHCKHSFVHDDESGPGK